MFIWCLNLLRFWCVCSKRCQTMLRCHKSSIALLVESQNLSRLRYHIPYCLFVLCPSTPSAAIPLVSAMGLSLNEHRYGHHFKSSQWGSTDTRLWYVLGPHTIQRTLKVFQVRNPSMLGKFQIVVFCNLNSKNDLWLFWFELIVWRL